MPYTRRHVAVPLPLPLQPSYLLGLSALVHSEVNVSCGSLLLLLLELRLIQPVLELRLGLLLLLLLFLLSDTLTREGFVE